MTSPAEALTTTPDLIHEKCAELRESGDGVHVDGAMAEFPVEVG